MLFISHMEFIMKELLPFLAEDFGNPVTTVGILESHTKRFKQ